ncbi:PTS system cellobiose-specific IIC component [Clostridium moniliforme]|uniref:Permease IIC component n=1 Tax=Clostridium moniliforme TaxID=39489 RepID=A0ABS4EYY7_9CLOT|nr:PTS transporter subunit EIIC [Clostridium moniliforme]MBP1889211.1 PTS system cellobiose-specific IIC component [Clostridium moniliforme]
MNKFMEKFMKFFEEKITPPLTKVSEVKHLRAIRDGIISTMPLILIGCMFLVIFNFPIASWKEWITPKAGVFLIPFRTTVSLMALYASYGMGYALAKSYNLDGVSGGVLTMAAFVLMNVPKTVLDAASGKELGWALPMEYLGGSGMFVAIICMLIAVEILRFCKVRNLTIKMPEQVPPSVARSFEALIPGLFIIVLVWVIRVLLGFDINVFLMNLFEPLMGIAGNSLIGLLIPVILMCLLWTTGISGDSVIGSIVRPIWLVLMDQNMAAVAAGGQAQNIGVEGFLDLFLWIGGTGGTLALCVLLLTSKSAYLKEVGKFSIIPGLFNISEPIMYGAPVAVNPILAIPFIIGPIITTCVTYFAMAWGLVAKVSVMAPWTLPSPIKAFLSTNDWRAVVLVIINFAIYVIVYYPFFKAYEGQLLSEEKSKEELA